MTAPGANRHIGLTRMVTTATQLAAVVRCTVKEKGERKIEATKDTRAVTGLGLNHANDRVEAANPTFRPVLAVANRIYGETN